MKRVLITGVAGMIGSHLLDALLERKYKVIGVDSFNVGRLGNIRHNFENRNFKFIKADILDFNVINKVIKNVDIIVHLAALKKIDENGDACNTLKVNAEGTSNIFTAAKKRKTKVIFASTSDVYGVSQDVPFKENGDLLIGPPVAKRWSYAVSKIYGEQLVLAHSKEFGVPVVIIRYFGGFSPRSSFTWRGGHIPLFVDAILQDKEIVIHGDGKQTRSMAYVDDLVNGTILTMENSKAIGEIFNIGNNEEMSIIDTAHLIHKIADTGKKLKIRYVPYKCIFGKYKEVQRRIPDLTKSKRILGFVPKVPFAVAIKIMVDARRKQLR